MSTIHIQHEGAVATVTLSNPGKLNALNVAMWERLRKGILQHIENEVHQAARACADHIAQGAPLAARSNRQMIRSLAPAVEPLNQQEMHAAFAFLDSQDYRDGVQNFLSKRTPVFQGK